MALPALSKTYCTRIDIPTTDNTSGTTVARNIIWFLKAALKNEVTTGTLTGSRHANSVWTCVGSSDGTTGALDGVDRWGTVSFDNTKIVSASSATPHSWIIVQNTTLGYQLLIDFNSASQDFVRIALTPTSVPFVLAGTATHSPPTTSMSIIWGSSSTDSTSASAAFTASTTAAVHNCSVTFDTSGECIFFSHKAGVGYSTGGVILTRPTETSAYDRQTLFFFGGIQAGAGNIGIGWPNTYGLYNMAALNPLGGTQSGGASSVNAGGGHFINTQAIWVDQFVNTKGYYWPVRAASISPYIYRGKLIDIYEVAHPGVGVLFPSPSAPSYIKMGSYVFPHVGGSPTMG